MAAAVTSTGGKVEIGIPRFVFAFKSPGGGSGYSYDVSADGERFLVNVVDQQEDPRTVTFLTNWPALLKK